MDVHEIGYVGEYAFVLEKSFTICHRISKVKKLPLVMHTSSLLESSSIHFHLTASTFAASSIHFAHVVEDADMSMSALCPVFRACFLSAHNAAPAAALLRMRLPATAATARASRCKSAARSASFPPVHQHTPFTTSTALSMRDSPRLNLLIRPSLVQPPHLSSLPCWSIRPYSSRTLAHLNISPTSSHLPLSRHLFNRTRRKRSSQSRSKTSLNNTSKAPNGAAAKSSRSNDVNTHVTAKAVGATPQSKNATDHPHNPQQFKRPTKEELLAAATGFWSRLGVRFKWFSIRSVRPFNMDEITAFFSWIVLGHLVWVIVGTTTFFSLLILAVNTVFAQGKLFNKTQVDFHPC